MKLVSFLAAFLIAGLASSSALAQSTSIPSGTLQSPNLVNISNSQATGWTGTTPVTGGGGFSGGNQPGYDSSTNTIYFGYTQSVAAYTYAFNEALRNSGMTILGYNYSWNYLNQGEAAGTLSAKVNFAGTDGSSLHTRYWTLGTTTDWTKISGTETFANNGMAVASIANFSLSFSGKDSRFWAGYYGPQVKDPSLSLNYTFDQCSSNPLSSPTCPGYATALMTQQCTANPLYNTSCPGYAAAYQIQQCTINPLTDPSCPGYASSYLTYQCSSNPLYSTACAGYETAYFNQQCSNNPLYSTRCSGYETAYKNQQCNANPLYAPDCPGYAAAYKNQQCTASPLSSTDCPGYAQAYLNSQCIKDSLYSNKCEGYATAYAIKNLVTFADSTISSAVNGSLSDTAATKANDPANTKVAVATVSTTVNTDGTVSTGVSATGDTNVDKAIAVKSASPSGNQPAAAVQLAAPPPAPMAQRQEQKQDDRKPDNKPDNKPEGGQDRPGAGPQQAQGGESGGSRPAPTARQELQARREAAVKAEAVEKGKNLANEMGKAADMESQKAVQNVVIQAMGFTPGFDTYNKAMIPDTRFYRPYTVYNGQVNVDNRTIGRRLLSGSDRAHEEMIESQYNKGK
jgi:hypothetical protein